MSEKKQIIVEIDDFDEPEQPREYTEQEVLEKFISAVDDFIDYWNDEPGLDQRDRLKGLAHSILCIIDGCNASIPAFILAPDPHPDDKEYLKENCTNWYPETTSEVNCNLSGSLHDQLAKIN